MQDRANVSADFLDLMKQEIIEVIKKYIDVDESAIDVRMTNKQNEDGTSGAPALYANIPIVSIKDDVLREKIKTKEKVNKDEENKKETEHEGKSKEEAEHKKENIENKEETQKKENNEIEQKEDENKEQVEETKEENEPDENIEKAEASSKH